MIKSLFLFFLLDSNSHASGINDQAELILVPNDVESI